MPAIRPSFIASLSPGLCRAVDHYYERNRESWHAEPINALTNLAFLAASLAAWRTLGAPSCVILPFGTPFLWDVLNAAMLSLSQRRFDVSLGARCNLSLLNRKRWGHISEFIGVRFRPDPDRSILPLPICPAHIVWRIER